MIQLFDEQALILKAEPFAEYDALVSAFSKQYGLMRGIAKYGFSSKQRGIFAIGNTVELEWTARLEDQLGQVSAELVLASGAMIMAQRERCYGLQSMSALLLMSFELRDPHPAAFHAAERLIEALRFGLSWQADYARFEAIVLRESGFGLGLDACIACGCAAPLLYLSPKSGCAVCAEDGAAYASKLFAYPALLRDEMHSKATPEAVQQALLVTGHFLQRWLYTAHDRKEPDARRRLIHALQKQLEV